MLLADIHYIQHAAKPLGYPVRTIRLQTLTTASPSADIPGIRFSQNPPPNAHHAKEFPR